MSVIELVIGIVVAWVIIAVLSIVANLILIVIRDPNLP